MRRFELSEGTSNKFWQIERDDSTMRVQFGRIGTNGQTQEKTFPTAAAAQAELDKLVKEKLKKGYTETGGDAVAATPVAAAPAAKPAPATKSAPAAKAASPAPAASLTTVPKLAPVARAASAGSIAWTDAALRHAGPIRGNPVVPARKPDAKSLYLALSKAMGTFDTLLDAGKRRTGADQDLMARARAAFSGGAPPAALELDSQAAACALIGPKVTWSDESRVDDFVRYWLATKGASFALRAFVKAAEMHVEASDKSVAIVAKDKAPGESPSWRTRDGLPWRGLRLAAASVDDAEHVALLAEAERLQRDTNERVRAALATAFERVEWCDRDIAALPVGDPPSWFWSLLVAARSTDDAMTLYGRATQQHQWSTAHSIDDLRFDLIARYGQGVVPMLVDVLEKGATAGVERMRSIAEALALVVSDEVAAFFVKNLGSKELRAVAAAYLQSHPVVSLGPLAEAAAIGKGPIAEAARAVLKPAVVSAPDLVASLSASLGAGAKHIIAQIREQTRPREEANAKELPRVLAAPPWISKVTVAAKVVVTLSTLPFTEAMAWKPGEEKQRTTGAAWLDERPDEAKANLDKVRAVSASKPSATEHSWNMTNASILAQLPKKALLEVLPSLDLSRFSWSYYTVATLLVARHGTEMIDFAMRSSEYDAVGAVTALARASSARVAPLMADAYVRLKRAKAEAADWLLSFPEAAAVGLVPLALGKPGKPRTNAEGALRFVSARGHRAIVEDVAKRYGSDAEAGVRALLDFDPLLAFPAKLPKMPPFWNANALTRPLLAGATKALPPAAVDAIGTMLAFTDVDDPYPGVMEVKEACDPESLAQMAWDLFQAWLVAGAPSKEAWAFRALALFGDDECARRLTPLVRAWPGEAAHARAVIGLDVLARIGTDVALMHLHGIAQKLKFKGLQEDARAKIDQIAEARGLTADELADRLVPDLGLDESGTLVLDFGARTFRVVFDELLKPAVADETGKRLPDLPKAKQTDDAEKASAATDAWKALKKDAKTIATGQILRLEIAMCSQRRWTTEVFQRFLVDHPLLVHVVRRLVWGTYDEAGKLGTCFRVAEDGTFADIEDNAFDLSSDARVGIVHRLDLSDATADRWGQIFGDYEILQPFAQLAREIATLTDAEKGGTKVERAVGLEVPTGKVLGLDGRGWRRGPPQDAGVVCWYEKHLAGGLLASLDLDPGIYTGMISESPQQKLGALTLSKGDRDWSGKEALAFTELAPIPLSELLRDLDSLRS